MSVADRAASMARTRSPRSSACRASRSRARRRSCSRLSRSARTQSSYQPGSSSSPLSSVSRWDCSSSDSGSSETSAARRTSATSTSISGSSPTKARPACNRPGRACWVCITARRRLASARSSVLSGHSRPATCGRARSPLSPRSAIRRCSRWLSRTSAPLSTSCQPPSRRRLMRRCDALSRCGMASTPRRSLPPEGRPHRQLTAQGLARWNPQPAGVTSPIIATTA